MRRLLSLAVFSGGITLFGGCASRIPTHPWRGHDDALRRIVDRAAHMETLTARCRLILKGSDGAAVQFDGTVAARMPGYLRLRAWKLSQPVYDVTRTPQGTWIFSAPPVDRQGDDAAPAFPTKQIIEAWEQVAAGIVDPMWDPLPDEGGRVVWVAKGAATDRITTTCTIDRSTQTVRECRMEPDEGGATTTTLRLGRYKMIDGYVWPMRLDLMSDFGVLTVLFDDVTVNSVPASNAFTPPRRAVKQE